MLGGFCRSPFNQPPPISTGSPSPALASIHSTVVGASCFAMCRVTTMHVDTQYTGPMPSECFSYMETPNQCWINAGPPSLTWVQPRSSNIARRSTYIHQEVGLAMRENGENVISVHNSRGIEAQCWVNVEDVICRVLGPVQITSPKSPKCILYNSQLA